MQLQRDKLEAEKKAITDEEDRERKDIMRHISKNFKYFLLSDRFQEISDFLEEKRKRRNCLRI